MGPLVHGSIPAAFPKPAVWVLMTSARSVTCPPFPPLRPKSLPPTSTTTTSSQHTLHASLCRCCGPWVLPSRRASGLFDVRWNRIERATRGPGEQRGGGGWEGGGLKKGTGKYQHRGVRGGGRTGRNGCWDTSHYNFNQPGAEGLGSPCTGGQKAQENVDGKEEKKSKKKGGETAREGWKQEFSFLQSKDWKR